MYSGSIEAKTYTGHTAINWQEDTATTGEGDRAILRVGFEIDGEQIEWTCWLDSLEKDGKPSSNARGLAALGVTRDDMQRWAQSGELHGLDRNTVNLVVEFDKGGYPKVKYVNDPREMRAAKPLDRGQRASFARRVAAALAQLPGSPAQRTTERQGPPPGRARPPAQAQRQEPPAYGADDDIPF